jgi:hypothetical protein
MGEGAAAGVVAGWAAPSSSAATRLVQTRRGRTRQAGIAWGIAADLADLAEVEAVCHPHSPKSLLEER